MQEHQQKRGSTGSPFTKSPYFTKFYRSDTASGMSLAAVGKFIRDAGFTPNTHRIVSWYTPVDVYIFRRALLGHSQLIDMTPTPSLMELYSNDGATCLQPYNLATIVKHSSNLTSTTTPWPSHSSTVRSSRSR
jgi:hypothetical protein